MRYRRLSVKDPLATKLASNNVSLQRVNTRAPIPLMIRSAAVRFNRLRRVVFEQSGVDFLAYCADVLRVGRFSLVRKNGVSRRSWHSTGRAFDYDQTNKALVIVPEAIDNKQYFRTYLHCSDQTGELGVSSQLADYRGYIVEAYVFDFTEAAENQGFLRIPALEGWQDPSGYNLREFWHYQFNPEGLSLTTAMRQLEYSRK